MEPATSVDVRLLAEDWDAIRRALQMAGRNPDADLAWLLEAGLDWFVRDEAEWKALEARLDDAAGTERRETQALLISMRASTIVAEIMMHELGERVRVLGGQDDGAPPGDAASQGGDRSARSAPSLAKRAARRRRQQRAARLWHVAKPAGPPSGSRQRQGRASWITSSPRTS
ncbi:MAG: hypothetical protein QME77_07890 [bacterium]|nr:hypothetical protein [bacterium]